MKVKFRLLASLCQLSIATGISISTGTSFDTNEPSEYEYDIPAGSDIDLFFPKPTYEFCVTVDKNTAIKQLFVREGPPRSHNWSDTKIPQVAGFSSRRQQLETFLIVGWEQCCNQYGRVELVAVQDAILTVITTGKKDIDFFVIIT